MSDWILICDDEKNIRLTVAAALENEGYEIKGAVNGEDALRQMEDQRFALLLLDLKMPGIDGLEVMRRLGNVSDAPNILILTAHGTIDMAVEAMKLGAVDFIQKPFSPEEIRQAVSRAIRLRAGKGEVLDYDSLIAKATQLIHAGKRNEALDAARSALYDNPQRPESYNLLGVLNELRGNFMEAQKFYRSALDIDPSYGPAQANLDRTCSFTGRGKIDLGEKPVLPEEQTGQDNTDGEENS